jgi:hypothetical protein
MSEITRCEYLAEVFPDYRAELRPFTGHPYAGRDQSGYGRKIPTDYIVWIGKRWHRVYVCCFSNAGTAYINTKEHRFLVVLDGDLAAIR